MSTIQLFAAAPSARIPSYRTVIMNQFRLIDTSRRFLLLLVVLVGGIALLLNPNSFGTSLELVAAPSLLFGAMVWPLFIWQGETRTKRVYHRWLPVNQVAHDFAKVIAGAIWFVIGGVMVAGLMKVLAILTLPSAAPTFPALIAMLAGSLVAYLLASLLPLLSDKPLHWFVAIWPLALLTDGLLNNYFPFGQLVLNSLVASDFGLMPAVAGADLLQTGLMSDTWPAAVMSWLVATVLWSIIAIAALFLASRWANRSAEA